jgi:hypothetical protein
MIPIQTCQPGYMFSSSCFTVHPQPWNPLAEVAQQNVAETSACSVKFYFMLIPSR